MRRSGVAICTRLSTKICTRLSIKSAFFSLFPKKFLKFPFFRKFAHLGAEKVPHYGAQKVAHYGAQKISIFGFSRHKKFSGASVYDQKKGVCGGYPANFAFFF